MISVGARGSALRGEEGGAALPLAAASCALLLRVFAAARAARGAFTVLALFRLPCGAVTVYGGAVATERASCAAQAGSAAGL
jgi:hypothetical protein